MESLKEISKMVLLFQPFSDKLFIIKFTIVMIKETDY